MALFQWVICGNTNDLLSRISAAVNRAGLEIDEEISDAATIYAKDKGGMGIGIKSFTSVLVSPNNASRDEFQVEVRSGEPMLMRHTRCEEVASILKKHIPSSSQCMALPKDGVAG